MMIYNTVDNPVIITIGTQTYRMERDSELELKIPSGEYYLRMEQVDRKGNPIIAKYSSYGYGKYKKTVTVINMSMSALLTMRKKTRIYIREKRERLPGYSKKDYEQLVFDLEIDDGELAHRQDGCLDASVGKKLKKNFVTGLVVTSVFYTLVAALGGAMLWMLASGIGEAALDKGDISVLLPYILEAVLIPVVSIGCVVWSLRKVKEADIFDKLPLLPDRSYYDYL